MGIKGMLHHIEIYVSDLERSERFWGWFLKQMGYQEFQRWDRGVSWKLDYTYLVFVQVDESYRDVPYHRRRVGLNHLAFYAESREDVDRLTELLRDKGTPILYEDAHPFAGGPEHYAVYFEDPDRIKVEVAAP